MAQHGRRSEDGDGETVAYGEPLVPVPSFGTGTRVVPVRWVRSVVLLSCGLTLVLSQLIAWLIWERDPVLSFLTVGAGLMSAPAVINLDERRHQ